MVTSGGQAELGRALGGYVNVVTKSGTNTCTATVYDYFRDDRFNAANALSGNEAADEPVAVRRQPRRPDRARPDLLLRQRRAAPLDQTGLVTISAPNVAPINARLAAVGYQGRALATGVYPNPVDTTNVLGKVDHQFSGRDQFSVRYSLYDVNCRQLARRRRPQRAERVGRTRQPRSDDRGQQHA